MKRIIGFIVLFVAFWFFVFAVSDLLSLDGFTMENAFISLKIVLLTTFIVGLFVLAFVLINDN